jgi:hypothetical protein
MHDKSAQEVLSAFVTQVRLPGWPKHGGVRKLTMLAELFSYMALHTTELGRLRKQQRRFMKTA